jgi:hypothetical protein
MVLTGIPRALMTVEAVAEVTLAGAAGGLTGVTGPKRGEDKAAVPSLLPVAETAK